MLTIAMVALHVSGCGTPLPIDSKICVGESYPNANRIAISTSGEDFAIAMNDSSTSILQLWNTETRKLHAEINSLTMLTTCMCFHPNGHLLAAGSIDGVVRIWDVSKPDAAPRELKHSHAVHSVAFDPGGEWLYTGADVMAKWRLSDFAMMPMESPQECSSGSLAVSHDGTYVTCGIGAVIRVLFTRDFSVAKTMPMPLRRKTVAAFPHPSIYDTPAVRCVRFSPVDNALVYLTESGVLVVRDGDDWQNERSIEAEQPASCFAFMDDGKQIAVGPYQQRLAVYSVASAKKLRDIETSDALDDQTQFVASPKAKIVVGAARRNVAYWSTE